MENQAPQISPRLQRAYKLKELPGFTGFGASYIYERIKAGAFPEPTKIGKSSIWFEDELIQWQQAQITASRGENI